MENYYEILEVSPNASKEIIEKAYRTLAKKYHPDANSEDNKQWAEEKFKKINEFVEPKPPVLSPIAASSSVTRNFSNIA